MSVFYITVSVIVGLIVLGGIFYISYLFETMKQRKAILLSRAGDKVQKYQRFLECFQEGVLPKEVQMVLIEEIIHNLNQILKLDTTDSKASRMMEEALAQQKSIEKMKNAPPQVPKVKDMQGAKEIQLQFKNLFKLLKYIGKTRKVHTKTINKNLKILQSLFVETAATVHRKTAEQAIAQNKGKLALYHLNLAIGEYARTDSRTFAKQIKDLRSRAQQLDAQLKEAKRGQQPKKETIENTKKDRGLGRMFDEDAEMSAKKNMRW